MSRRTFFQLTLLVAVLALSVSLQSLAAFSEPSSAPPAGDAYAPLTTSPTGEIKTGNLTVNGLGISGTGSVLLVPNGNVGIGTTNPGQKLDVNGIVKATGFQLTSGAGAGKVLTSDASGNATWQAASGGVTVSSALYKITALGCTKTINNTTGANVVGIPLSLQSTCQTNICAMGTYWSSYRCDGSCPGGGSPSQSCPNQLIGHLVQ